MVIVHEESICGRPLPAHAYRKDGLTRGRVSQTTAAICGRGGCGGSYGGAGVI